ncbi:MAG: CoA transferase [Chloroflexi bacterium]|nr:CoA transferase [Chloroflexota bacterium]
MRTGTNVHDSGEPPATGPLRGLQVLELGTLIAGPYAARLLAEYGAEVIKVESPDGGDPLRGWRLVHQGTSLWWYAQARNKRSITLDLRNPKGQELARRLAARADVLVENFRPGTLERWGLGWDDLHRLNRRLIMVRMSGYGQTGPLREKPGFAAIAESIGGMRYITGYPDRPPVRVGVSLGDSIAGLFGVVGALTAIYNRDVVGTGEGQVVDVALHEGVFGLMESMLSEYDFAGVVRERTGAALPGITPSNTYPTNEGKYVIIGANSDSIFKHLMEAIGRPDIAADSRFADNAGRSRGADFLDEVIAGWTSQHSLEECIRLLDEAGVPAGPIYSIADIVRDPQYAARGMIEEVEAPGIGRLKIPGIVPKFSATPPSTRWIGPPLGAHNDEVYRGLLGLSDAEFQALRSEGVI